MSKYIASYKDFSFIVQVYNLIDQHAWDSGVRLRALIKLQRKIVRAANYAFDDTYNMPCGYQDTAGDKAEIAGREYMQMVHAYLTIKYGAFPKRFTQIVDDTIVAEG